MWTLAADMTRLISAPYFAREMHFNHGTFSNSIVCLQTNQLANCRFVTTQSRLYARASDMPAA
jgi:hypothetical protein